MDKVGQPERATQNRVIALFRDELGYRYTLQASPLLAIPGLNHRIGTMTAFG